MRIVTGLVVLAAMTLVLACGGGDDDEGEETPMPSPEATAEPTTAPTATREATATPEETAAPETEVTVTLREYELVTDVTSGPPGNFVFSITNEGPAETHVFMIIQTDLDADAIPVTSTGQIVSGDDAVILANTPGIGAGGTDTMAYELQAGNYVFICNLSTEGVSEGASQSHYVKGMYAPFTVE